MPKKEGIWTARPSTTTGTPSLDTSRATGSTASETIPPLVLLLELMTIYTSFPKLSILHRAHHSLSVGSWLYTFVETSSRYIVLGSEYVPFTLQVIEITPDGGNEV